MSDLQRFMDVLSHHEDETERIIAGAFVGDPDDDVGSGWKPFGCWKDGSGRWRVPGNPTFNRYVSISAFKQNEFGEWRRQQELFGSGRAFMIDDLGTGPGAKIPFSALCNLPPTALIETSPDNFQAWYVFREPVLEESVLRALQDSFVDKYCNGKDTGMKGATRVGRLPDSVNGKQRYNGWVVKLRVLNPTALYTPRALADVFGISCVPLPARVRAGATPDEANANVANFNAILKLLGRQLKTDKPNRKGWIHIACPWVEEHTKGADNGASIRVPEPENGWRGAFVCHHGSHKVVKGVKGGKTWHDLEIWVQKTLLAGAEGDIRKAIMDYWIYDGMKDIVEALEEANKNG